MRRVAAILLLSVVATIGLAPCCGFTPAANAASAQAKATTTLHIDGMTCGGCETAVKMVLKKTPGVLSSTVSYEEKRAIVTYEPAKTTPAKIARAIATALSYKVTVADAKPSAAAPVAAASASCAAPSTKPASGNAVALSAYKPEALRAAFNGASDRVRVVALLSPTCGPCQKGQGVVQSVFAKYPNDERLRGFVVWLPMLPSDSERAAGAQAASFVDARVAQQWDGTRASGNLLAKTLKLKSDAWDVYLLYAPGVQWTGDTPPAPTFWMHQLRAETGADQKVCLNPAVFAGKVAALLGNEKGRA